VYFLSACTFLECVHIPCISNFLGVGMTTLVYMFVELVFLDLSSG
jgi:hypothetical protein